MNMRIYANRFYVTATTPGISGFQRWDEKEYRIVTGLRAKSRRLDVVGELIPVGGDWYRLEDGHVPDCQPKVEHGAAFEWLTANPYQAIVRLAPSDRATDLMPHFKPFQVSA
jgi:hypothetical protein